jgi:hypothetical protein
MNRRSNVVIGLLGAIVGLLVVLMFQLQAVPGAQGQGAASGLSSEWLMATATTTGGKAACFIFNTKDVKLGMYVSTGNTMALAGVRLCSFDMQLIQYPSRQSPSVQQIRDMVKKAGGKF